MEHKLLGVLGNLIGKIYNKKVDLNIVNLKSLAFNSDIFTKLNSIGLKSVTRLGSWVEIRKLLLSKILLRK